MEISVTAINNKSFKRLNSVSIQSARERERKSNSPLEEKNKSIPIEKDAVGRVGRGLYTTGGDVAVVFSYRIRRRTREAIPDCL